MLTMCIEASVIVISLVLKISEKVGRENPNFQTLVLFPFVQFKNQAKLRLGSKAKL